MTVLQKKKEKKTERKRLQSDYKPMDGQIKIMFIC